MTLKTGCRTELPGTISSLRFCNELQSEVISNMEQYQAVVEHGGHDEDRSGRKFGYLAELAYLHDRRSALDSLIEAVERYHVASEGGGWTGRKKQL